MYYVVYLCTRVMRRVYTYVCRGTHKRFFSAMAWEADLLSEARRVVG